MCHKITNHGEQPQAERSCRLKREHFGRVQILTEKSRLIAPLVHGCLPLLTADCFWTPRERRTCGIASRRRPCVSALRKSRSPAAALSTRMVKLSCLYCVLLKVFASFHGLSYGGAKARTAALRFDILESVVRRLRTTQRKFSLSDSTVCAFALREKRPRSVGP